MEITSLFYSRLPNEIVMLIYLHLVRLKKITNAQKKDLENCVNLFQDIRKMFDADVILFNDLRYNIFIYNRLMAFKRWKEIGWSKFDYLDKGRTLNRAYRVSVFSIDVHKNAFSAEELERLVFKTWLSLNNDDRVLFHKIMKPQLRITT